MIPTPSPLNWTEGGAEQITYAAITTDFGLDEPLADSLFSVEVPPGYRLANVNTPELNRAAELSRRVKSAGAATRIVTACIRFEKEHGGQWPESLEQLAPYGIDAQALVNPRQPDSVDGWVYVRPRVPLNKLPPHAVLVHEAFSSWGDGVNVGFADGHVEFVKDQSKFNQLLRQ